MDNMQKSIDEMKLDIIRWQLEDAEKNAEEEYEEYVEEFQETHGNKFGLKGYKSYREDFYKSMYDDLLHTIYESPASSKAMWEQMAAKMQPGAYAE